MDHWIKLIDTNQRLIKSIVHGSELLWKLDLKLLLNTEII